MTNYVEVSFIIKVWKWDDEKIRYSRISDILDLIIFNQSKLSFFLSLYFKVSLMATSVTITSGKNYTNSFK